MKLGTAIVGNDRKFIRKINRWEFTDVTPNNTMLIDYNYEFRELNGDIIFNIPVPEIQNVRDFYSFESHVKNSRKRRGLDMEPEWYNIPAYYYQNRSSVLPTEREIKYPSFTKQLDLEVELAFVIGKSGINLSRENAIDNVLGFMLANDWTARDIQKSEMKIGLGPSKSKDFATSLGPYITTIDELSHKIERGRIYLEIELFINGVKIRTLSTDDMYWTINDLVSYASKDCEIKLGDVFMTGTLAGGSQAELDEDFLKKGDLVEIRSKELGILKNKVV